MKPNCTKQPNSQTAKQPNSAKIKVLIFFQGLPVVILSIVQDQRVENQTRFTDNIVETVTVYSK